MALLLYFCINILKTSGQEFFKISKAKLSATKAKAKREETPSYNALSSLYGGTMTRKHRGGGYQFGPAITHGLINNYGQEDLTMLTDKYMRKMVIYPYTAIPKMIKKIHFNDKYPANQNIRLLNKKGNKLQIRNNDKWEFVDKKETMEQLINEKNYQLDQYYEENKEAFNDTYQTRFDQFQDKMGAGERKVIKNINTGSELVFWNSM